MITFYGYLVLIIVFFFIVDNIKKGPFIKNSGIIYYVNVENQTFDKNNFFLKQGDQIIIVNRDQYRHAFNINDETQKNSDIMYQYDEYNIRFNKAGNFTIESSLYEDMPKLFITVIEPPKGQNYFDIINNNIVKMISKIPI